MAEITKRLPGELEFDSVVIIMGDRKADSLANWWYFSGHPDHWGSQELSNIAQQMTAVTAELLKSDVNVKQRPLDVKTKVSVSGPTIYEDTVGLCVIGIPVSIDPVKRMWFLVELIKWDFGLLVSLKKWDIYWSLRFMLGPISFRVFWPR